MAPHAPAPPSPVRIAALGIALLPAAAAGFRLAGRLALWPERARLAGILLPGGPVFATLPIDRQLDTFMDRAAARFGTDQLSELGRGDTLARLLDRFAALDGSSQGGPASTASSPALMLLRGY